MESVFYVMKWKMDVVRGCRRLLEDLGLSGSVFADLMMEEAKPSFKKKRLFGIAYPQGSSWISSRRILEFRSEMTP